MEWTKVCPLIQGDRVESGEWSRTQWFLVSGISHSFVS